MRSIALLFSFSFAVTVGVAQQVWVYGPSNTKPPVPAPRAATNETAGKPVIVYHQIDSGSNVSDSKAEQLVELRGVRKRFEYDDGSMMATEKRNILHNFPNLNPAFVDEWATRVSAKMNADEYVAIAARVYASHFSDDELTKLVDGETNANAGKRSGLAPSLVEKWTRLLPTMGGEIEGEYAREGAKFSIEVAQELARQHPEWIRGSAQASGVSK